MPRSLTRRRFTAALLGTGCSAATATHALADDKPPPGDAGSPAATDPKESTTPPPEVEPDIEDLLLLALLRQYPMPALNVARARGIRAGIGRNLRNGDRLREGLVNSDEPATVFQARRWDE